MNMNRAFQVVLIVAGGIQVVGTASAESNRPGTEEFGLTQKELVQAVEKVESLIANCMHKQGFEYVPNDFKTVHRGMVSDKSLPGMDEEEFVEQYGFGVSTLYTGRPPQLNDGYSPGRIGLGERNVEIFKKLSPADQAAYNRALLGDNLGATFAVSLEQENFSRCGGCTVEAVKQVFKPDQLKTTYMNPLDALINKDPRMKAALRTYAEKMRAAGLDYNHPDEVEIDITKRLDAILGGGTPPVDKLSPEQQAALKKLQEYERRAAKANLKLQAELFDPIEERIEKEMYARQVK
jgi:hypothetical protein